MDDAEALLKTSYPIETKQETRDFDRDLAANPKAGIAAKGGITPTRSAAALAEFAADKAAPILDIGCGAGFLGITLRKAGFGTIDGCDQRADMLKRAGAQKGLYRKLLRIDMANPLPFARATYANIAAVGGLATDQSAAIDHILAALPEGGLFVFSLDDTTLQDPTFEARIAENIDTGMARLLFKQRGPNSPQIGLYSTVYVLERA